MYTSDLVKNVDPDRKIKGIKKKIAKHDKYIITIDLNKLMKENVSERLKQETLLSKMPLLIS